MVLNVVHSSPANSNTFTLNLKFYASKFSPPQHPFRRRVASLNFLSFAGKSKFKQLCLFGFAVFTLLREKSGVGHNTIAFAFTHCFLSVSINQRSSKANLLPQDVRLEVLELLLMEAFQSPNNLFHFVQLVFHRLWEVCGGLFDCSFN